VIVFGPKWHVVWTCWRAPPRFARWRCVGISEHSAGSDNRLLPPDDPKAGVKLRAERCGDE